MGSLSESQPAGVSVPGLAASTDVAARGVDSFAGYRPLPGTYDEIFDSEGRIHPSLSSVMEPLREIGLREYDLEILQVIEHVATVLGALAHVGRHLLEDRRSRCSKPSRRAR